MVENKSTDVNDGFLLYLRLNNKTEIEMFEEKHTIE